MFSYSSKGSKFGSLSDSIKVLKLKDLKYDFVYAKQTKTLQTSNASVLIQYKLLLSH